MIATTESMTEARSQVLHPLDPLSAEEIAAAVALIRASERCGPNIRFASITLSEPHKSVVLDFTPGDSIGREALAVLLDNADGSTYEVLLSLNQGLILSWKHIPGVQPGVMLDEFFEAEEAIKRDPGFQEALRKRGITDFNLLMVDPWSAGNYGDEPGSWQGRRLIRALTWVRSDPTDNGYAYPIEGLVAVFDLNEMRVLEVIDRGATPLPPKDGNYLPDRIGELRNGQKPLEIVQPDGAKLYRRWLPRQLAEVELPDWLDNSRGAGPLHNRLQRCR
jgi:primary-amine oxidase